MLDIFDIQLGIEVVNLNDECSRKISIRISIMPDCKVVKCHKFHNVSFYSFDILSPVSHN